jgi:hypothetical protein
MSGAWNINELHALLVDVLGFQAHRSLYDFRPSVGEFRRLFYSSRPLVYQERFKLTVFMLWNHCSPDQVMAWYQIRGLLRDHSAVLHVQSLLQEWSQNDPKWNSYFTFCLGNECWWDIGSNQPHVYGTRG